MQVNTLSPNDSEILKRALDLKEKSVGNDNQMNSAENIFQGSDKSKSVEPDNFNTNPLLEFPHHSQTIDSNENKERVQSNNNKPAINDIELRTLDHDIHGSNGNLQIDENSVLSKNFDSSTANSARNSQFHRTMNRLRQYLGRSGGQNGGNREGTFEN